MALTKEQKKVILDKLNDVFAKNPSAAFVKFHKLTVADASIVRRTLRASGVGYFVAKKTLIKKALTDAKITGTMPELDGEVAVAYSTDLIAPARETYSFQKKLDNQVALIGGVFEGAYKTLEEMVALASIPSQKTLYAQIANVINSPIQGFVIALSEIAKKKESASGASSASAEAPAAAPEPAPAA